MRKQRERETNINFLCFGRRQTTTIAEAWLGTFCSCKGGQGLLMRRSRTFSRRKSAALIGWMDQWETLCSRFTALGLLGRGI
jgi:hypothetical protein